MNCRCFIRLSLFILVSVLAVPCLFADSVDDYLRQQMNARHIPGLVLLVLKDGKVIKQQSYGLANIELGVPTGKDNVFPLDSVTKVFTATAVYMLVQEGKIRLGDKVVQLLPDLPDFWSEITVLNCLSHTTGISDIFPGSPASAPDGWVAAATQEEALQKLAAVPLVYSPGEKSSYNQTGFLLLKMIVERVSGMPLEEFLAKRVFAPLGMIISSPMMPSIFCPTALEISGRTPMARNS